MCHVLTLQLAPQIGEDPGKWLTTRGKGGASRSLWCTYFHRGCFQAPSRETPRQPVPPPACVASTTFVERWSQT